MTKSHLLPLAAALLSSSAFCATVPIGPGTYTENFNSLIASDAPAPGWNLRTGATATSLGSGALNAVPPTLRAWTHTNGQFKNVSSTNIPQASNATEQTANPNRALGLNQVIGFGDPGASFGFSFSSTEVRLNTVSIDLLLTNNTNKSTTFLVQYGVGAAPTEFFTLASWSDQDVAGGWGSTTLTFDRSQFGAALDHQPQAWFRVAALNQASTTGGAYDQVAIDNFSITASAVPEPASVLLGALGLLGLVSRRRAFRRG